MSSNFYAFLLSTIAGFSTLIGFLFIFIKKDTEVIISRALGFASGVMLTVSIIDLIPNSLNIIINKYNFIYSLFLVLVAFLIGIIISNIINQKVDKHSKNNSKLYKLGIITMLVIILYSIIAGMMVNISINELYKESNNYNKKNTIIYFIIGILIMILNHLIFN